MLGKIVLWISAFIFVSYGLACFFSPGLPAGYAGLTMTNADAFAEMRAMYGGLQTGFGLFCALGAMREQHYRSALTLIVYCVGLLAFGRVYSALAGVGDLGVYTWGAMSFEFVTASLAAIALRKN